MGHMPKLIPQEELDAILEIVAAHPNEGVQGDTIREELKFGLSRRTLQRRLNLLIEQGKLISEGRGRGRRYRIPENHQYAKVTDEAHFTDKFEAELYVPVSDDGNEIRAAVRQPLQERQPVGYQREFLDHYRPNETCYLSETSRQQLLEMGQTPDRERPAGTYVRQIFNRLLIDLSWNSSRLEGNTYSLLETERLLEQGESAEGKDARDAQMILNHKSAIELLVEESNETGFNRYTILNLHGLLSENLLGDPQASGRLRRITVEIGSTVYHPLDIPQLIEENFQQILDTVTAINDPFEQAFFAMVHLPYLQPFEDVNKRVSRLAANIPLIRNNLCPLSFTDVPERAYVDGILGVYELNRVELLRDVFVWAYERSCKRYSAVRRSLGEPDPFRLRYRSIIGETVAVVVREGLDSKSATAKIKQQAEENIQADDRAKFIEVVETEIMSLHEGNISRYRLRPSEFQAWQENWK